MTTITALPEAPNRGTDDPANFSSKADTFVAALQTFQVEANLVATETNAAAGSAVAAAAAATSVTGAAKWAGTTTSYTNGAAVWSPANYKTYRLSIASKAANVANTDPSVDTASWALVNGTGDVIATAAQTLTNKTITSPTITGTGAAAFGALSYTGTLTGGTGVVNLGAGQFYKSASGGICIGTPGPTYGSNIEIVSALSYGASADKTLTLGGATNGYVDGGAAAAFRLNVAGAAAGQSLRFDSYIQGSGWAERMRISSSGSLLIGTTVDSSANANCITMSPANLGMSVQHASTAPAGSLFINLLYNASAIGSITQSGTTAVLYNTTSDARLKTNIVDAPDAATLIDSIQVRSFDWISDSSHQRYGMVAQELFEVAPEAVHTPVDPAEMMAVDYSKLVPMLIKEVQSLRARVAVLEA